MKNPCFDEATHTDCPGRHSGCAVDCPAWAEYVRQRNAEYAKKRAESDAVSVILAGRAKRSRHYHKHSMKSRQRRNKYYSD